MRRLRMVTVTVVTIVKFDHQLDHQGARRDQTISYLSGHAAVEKASDLLSSGR